MTHEIARRLVLLGNSVEWFAASFPGARGEEVIDGLKIVRAGRQWSVHWHAFVKYRSILASEFDVVIDQVNTIPFLTPLWARIPTVMLIHQLAGEVWWYESVFPINALGRLFEPLYLRLYRHTPAVTVSQSTEHDLRRLGLARSVTIMPIGIDQTPCRVAHKASSPTFIFVGRLARSKRVEHILRAMCEFRRSTGTGMLWLVGSGAAKYQQSLEQLAGSLGINDHVVFWGRVPETKKRRLMAKAHVLLMTSVREGWGLVVTEAASCGTPAAVYDVPGLRDAVRNGRTGVVVEPDPAKLSKAMMDLMLDKSLYERLASEGQRWSGTFTFDESARVVHELLSKTTAA